MLAYILALCLAAGVQGQSTAVSTSIAQSQLQSAAATLAAASAASVLPSASPTISSPTTTIPWDICSASNQQQTPAPTGQWLLPLNGIATYSPVPTPGNNVWSCDQGEKETEGVATPVSLYTNMLDAAIFVNYQGYGLAIKTAYKFDRGLITVWYDSLGPVFYDLYNANDTGEQGPVYIWVPPVNNQTRERQIQIRNNAQLDARFVGKQTNQSFIDVQGFYISASNAQNYQDVPGLSQLTFLTPSASAGPDNGGNSQLAALLGGVVGGTLGAVFFGIAVFAYVRRRARPRLIDDRRDSCMIEAHLDPFIPCKIAALGAGNIGRHPQRTLSHLISGVASLQGNDHVTPTGRSATLTSPSTIEQSADEYATFGDIPAASMSALRAEAIDMAPPSYAQISSPTPAELRLPASETSPSSSDRGDQELRSPVRYATASSIMSDAKGWMPGE